MLIRLPEGIADDDPIDDVGHLSLPSVEIAHYGRLIAVDIHDSHSDAIVLARRKRFRSEAQGKFRRVNRYFQCCFDVRRLFEIKNI